MIQCFKFRLQGKVIIAPTALYTTSGTKLEAVRWTMQIYLPPFEDGGKATEMNVEVEAWGKSRAAAETLREGQEACVTGNVVRRRMLTTEGNYAQRKDGSPIWLTDFRAQEVFVAPLTRSGLGGGNTAPRNNQPRQQGGWTPPRNAQQAYEQRRTAAHTPPMSQEEEEDIPF